MKASVPGIVHRCASISGKSKIANLLSKISSADVQRYRLVGARLAAPRRLQKDHVHHRLGGLDALLDLVDRPLDVGGGEVVAELDVRVDKNLLRREVHRQQLDDLGDVRVRRDGGAY